MSTGSLRDAFRAFTTACALITTDGPEGPNVMAAEWTFNVSYDPFLILVAIDPGNKTHDMVRESGEFGVSLLSAEQAAAMGFAGHYSKTETDKLTSDIFELVPAKRIHAPLVRGSLLAAECKLVATYPMGDHTGFLGEVLEYSVDPEKSPLILHHGSHRLGERIVRQPALVLAVTPMRAEPGQAIEITGELTGGERGGKPVSASFLSPAGISSAAGDSVTAEDGSFRMRLDLPAALASGPYGVEAHSGDLSARARFEVSSTADGVRSAPRTP